jgi:hypothetical protein
VSGRAGVVLVSRERCALGVFTRSPSGRVVRVSRASMALPIAPGRLPGWPAVREAVRQVLAGPRARRLEQLVVALRADLRGVRWRKQAAAAVRARGGELLSLSPDDEARWLFLGAVLGTAAQDGLVVEVEAGRATLARFRGRVLATVAQVPWPAGLADAAVVPLGPDDALMVCGAVIDGAVGDADARPRLTASHIADLGARRSERAGARALRRLLDRAGRGEAAVARSPLHFGLAAALLRVAVPEVR